MYLGLFLGIDSPVFSAHNSALDLAEEVSNDTFATLSFFEHGVFGTEEEGQRPRAADLVCADERQEVVLDHLLRQLALVDRRQLSDVPPTDTWGNSSRSRSCSHLKSERVRLTVKGPGVVWRVNTRYDEKMFFDSW